LRLDLFFSPDHEASGVNASFGFLFRKGREPLTVSESVLAVRPSPELLDVVSPSSSSVMTPRASTPTLVALFLALYSLFRKLPALSNEGEFARDSGGEKRPSPESAMLAPSEGDVK